MKYVIAFNNKQGKRRIHTKEFNSRETAKRYSKQSFFKGTNPRILRAK